MAKKAQSQPVTPVRRTYTLEQIKATILSMIARIDTYDERLAEFHEACKGDACYAIEWLGVKLAQAREIRHRTIGFKVQIKDCASLQDVVNVATHANKRVTHDLIMNGRSGDSVSTSIGANLVQAGKDSGLAILAETLGEIEESLEYMAENLVA